MTFFDRRKTEPAQRFSDEQAELMHRTLLDNGFIFTLSRETGDTVGRYEYRYNERADSAMTDLKRNAAVAGEENFARDVLQFLGSNAVDYPVGTFIKDVRAANAQLKIDREVEASRTRLKALVKNLKGEKK